MIPSRSTLRGGNGRAMVWPDGKPEKRSAGKERRRTSRLFSEGLQLRNRTGSTRQQTKEYPARGKDSGGVGGLQGKSRMRILASALGACLTRQAGFATARPAAIGGITTLSTGVAQLPPSESFC